MQKWINTKVVWDSEGNVIEREGFWWSGPVLEAKGGASQAEQSQANQQMAMQNALAQQQLSLMQGQLTGINNAVDPIINQILSGQTPTVLQPLQSALTASYMNQLPQTYRGMVGQLNQDLTARGITGGQNAGGGAIGQDFGQMAALLGQQQQAGATNAALTLNNASTNMLQNDLGLKLGIANAYQGATNTFNQGASSALSSGVTAAGNADQAQTSWMGPVFGGLAGLGGSAITKWCWVASTCFEGGFNSPQVQFIRLRLAVRALNDWRWTLLVGAYGATGYHLAKVVNRSSWLKKQTRKLFDAFIARELDTILNDAVQAYEL